MRHSNRHKPIKYLGLFPIDRFRSLVIVLLLFFIIASFLPDNYLGKTVLNITFTFIVVSGIYAISHKRRLFIITLCIGGSALVAEWFALAYHSQNLSSLNYFLQMCFCFLNTSVILAEVLSARKITLDTIYGAIAAYLFIGLSWGMLFTFLANMLPSAFVLPANPSINSPILVSTMIYFSFVTLTTLGFGDIIPILPITHTLVFLEAIIGQMFLVIFVARLVGFHVAQSANGNND